MTFVTATRMMMNMMDSMMCMQDSMCMCRCAKIKDSSCIHPR